MDSKLTLRLSKKIIERAKKYASRNNTSLSKLVENQLQKLVSEKKDKQDISPLVKSLSGVIHWDKDQDIKKGYGEFLKEKYK